MLTQITLLYVIHHHKNVEIYGNLGVITNNVTIYIINSDIK